MTETPKTKVEEIAERQTLKAKIIICSVGFAITLFVLALYPDWLYRLSVCIALIASYLMIFEFVSDEAWIESFKYALIASMCGACLTRLVHTLLIGLAG